MFIKLNCRFKRSASGKRPRRCQHVSASGANQPQTAHTHKHSDKTTPQSVRTAPCFTPSYNLHTFSPSRAHFLTLNQLLSTFQLIASPTNTFSRRIPNPHMCYTECTTEGAEGTNTHTHTPRYRALIEGAGNIQNSAARWR